MHRSARAIDKATFIYIHNDGAPYAIQIMMPLHIISFFHIRLCEAIR